jgi:hypothetical protein
VALIEILSAIIMTIQPENSPYEGFQAEIADNTFSPIIPVIGNY